MWGVYVYSAFAVRRSKNLYTSHLHSGLHFVHFQTEERHHADGADQPQSFAMHTSAELRAPRSIAILGMLSPPPMGVRLRRALYLAGRGRVLESCAHHGATGDRIATEEMKRPRGPRAYV